MFSFWWPAKPCWQEFVRLGLSSQIVAPLIWELDSLHPVSENTAILIPEHAEGEVQSLFSV